MFAIYKREMLSYFRSPLGYTFMAIFLCLSGVLFSTATLQKGTESDATYYFVYLLISFIIVLPLLTMKLFSEERKTKTEQLLLTSPVTLTGMVLGKFLAAYTMFLLTFAVSSLSFISLYLYGSPNTAFLLGNTIGYFTVGGGLPRYRRIRLFTDRKSADLPRLVQWLFSLPLSWSALFRLISTAHGCEPF